MYPNLKTIRMKRNNRKRMKKKAIKRQIKKMKKKNSP